MMSTSKASVHRINPEVRATSSNGIADWPIVIVVPEKMTLRKASTP